MKKLLLFIISILVAFNATAQPQKNEIALEYGQFTLIEGAYLLGGVFGAVFSLGHFTFDNSIMTGSVAVEYDRNVNNWFSYGGLVSGELITSDAYTVDSEGNKTYNGKYDMGAATLTPIARFHWFRHPHFGMYSKIGAGLGIALSSEPSVFPSFQVSPVCMEFGGGKWKGVSEIGFGIQGIMTLGVKRCF